MLYIVGGRGKLGSGLRAYLTAVSVGRDLRELSSLTERDVVINAAGLVKGPREKLWESNAELPALLLEKAEEAGAFLIHISSIAVYGDRDFGKGFDPYSEAELKATDDYGRSKLEGEKRVRGRAAILRLGPVFGPTFPAYAKLLRFMRKRGWAPLIGKGDNWIPLTYIGDVARAVSFLAEQREPVVEVLAGPGERQRKVFEQAFSLLSLKPRFLSIPRVVAFTLGKLLGYGEEVKVLGRHRPFPKPFIPTTPFHQALSLTMEAYKRKGWL